jgi:hypothetical protein
MDTIKPDKYDLKKFGASLGTVFLVVTFFISRKSPQNIWPTLLLSLAFYVSALIKPSLLKPFHAFFMKVGSVMTWIITRFFLLIIFLESIFWIEKLIGVKSLIGKRKKKILSVNWAMKNNFDRR